MVKIIIGELKYSSGANNSQPSIKLSENLLELGFEFGAFQNRNSATYQGSSIDYSKTEIQPGDDTPNLFSFTSKDEDYRYDQIPCWLTYTNEQTHETIRETYTVHRCLQGL